MIKDTLKAALRSQHASLKADAVVAMTQKRKRLRGVFDIEIVDVQKINGGVQALVKAWKNGKQIGFGADGSVDIERFILINPPMLVPDLLGDVEVIYDDGEGQPDSVRVEKYREDPQEALLNAIEETIELMTSKVFDSKKIQKNKLGSTVATIYATESGTGLMAIQDTSWANARGNANADSVATSTIQISNSQVSGSDWRLNRGMLSFDTSVLGAGATINSAVLSILQWNRTFPYSTTSANITGTTKSDHTTLVVADFGTMEGVEFSTDLSIPNPASDTWRDWTFNASGLADINKSGYSFFVARPVNDIDNAAPGFLNNTAFYSSFETGTTKDPKIVIDYTSPLPVSGNLMMMGVG